MSIFHKIEGDPNYNPNAAVSWFRRSVTNAFAGLGTQKFLGDHQYLQSTSFMPGQMVFFGYDPKYKEELPYYDKFPLILPFSVDAKHFSGINLHYIPYERRIVILDKLVELATDKNVPEKMQIALSWKMLKGLSEHKAINHAVKTYLKGHVKTRFVLVPTQSWPIAAFLPLSRFAKMDESSVWRDMK